MEVGNVRLVFEWSCRSAKDVVDDLGQLISFAPVICQMAENHAIRIFGLPC